MHLRDFCAVAFAAVLVAPAWADEPARVALVIGNTGYVHAPNAVTARGDAIAVADALTASDYEVDLGVDLDRRQMRARIEAFSERARGAESAVVYFSGHAQRAAGVSHLAPVDARGDSPSAVALDTLPLWLLLESTSEAEAGVVFLDVAQLAGFTPRRFAEPGFAEIGAPEGVLLVSAAAPGRAIRRSPERESRFARLVADRFLEPDAPVMQVAQDIGGALWFAGGTAAEFALYTPEPMGANDADLEREIELAIWQSAERSGAEEDYRAYLDQYPEGAFAALATNRLRQIAEASRDPNEVEEEALALKRAERRAIQRALRAVGQDPRGIDGVFGPATRRAIRRWQRAAGFAPTGYLTRDQLAALRQDAERAAAARAEAEAAAKRAEAAREEAYWQKTGANGKVKGLRAYLERYPEGVYAEKAEAALERHAEVARDTALKQERAFWVQVTNANTARAYRRYLARYPDGTFHAKAERRLARIEAAERADAERKRARGIEASLRLDRPDRRSVERRLARLNYDPGPRDGIFDGKTRNAIARFQRDYRLKATGFLNRRSLVTLVRQTGGLARGQTANEIAINRLLRALEGDD
ncbi:MAG: peptidoglycan-binding protein [Pseudomonadota bacterium]